MMNLLFQKLVLPNYTFPFSKLAKNAQKEQKIPVNIEEVVEAVTARGNGEEASVLVPRSLKRLFNVKLNPTKGK